MIRQNWLSVATLACVSLLACIQCVAGQAVGTRDGTKDLLPVPAPASNACDAREASSQPSTTPMAQAQTQETFDADVALVRRAIDSLRSSGAEEASRIEATISDTVARKLTRPWDFVHPLDALLLWGVTTLVVGVLTPEFPVVLLGAGKCLCHKDGTGRAL